MKGTEKQIKWAEDIIESARGTIKANIENIKAQQEKYNCKWRQDELEAFELCSKSLEELLSKVTEASQVINMRHKISSHAIIEMVQEYLYVTKNRKQREKREKREGAK